MRLLERIFGRILTVEELDARADLLTAGYDVIWREEIATLPLGYWTIEDYERCASGFRGHTGMASDALMTAISAGHLRDLGFGASRSWVAGLCECVLHGDACRRFREETGGTAGESK